MHGSHNLYFKRHVRGRVTFCRRLHAVVCAPLV